MDKSDWYELPSSTRDKISNELIRNLPERAEILAIEATPEGQERRHLNALADAADLEVAARKDHQLLMGMAYKGMGIITSGLALATGGSFVYELFPALLWVGVFITILGVLATGTLVCNHDLFNSFRTYQAAHREYAKIQRRPPQPPAEVA